jgi:signal transduction histidine kinase
MLARVAVERGRIEDSVQTLTSGLILAQERERKRVAAELHDGINQDVAVIAIDLGLLVQRLPESRDQIREELLRIQERAFGISIEIRNLAHNLHPAVIEHLGLCAALRVYCRDFERREGIPVRFSSSNASSRYEPRIELTLYRICQEALSNVRKHARASSVRVSLRGRRGGLLLTVADDGCGFDPASAGDGMGLVSIWERARLAGGEAVIRSQLNIGTELEVFVPLPRRVNE